MVDAGKRVEIQHKIKKIAEDIIAKSDNMAVLEENDN